MNDRKICLKRLTTTVFLYEDNIVFDILHEFFEWMSTHSEEDSELIVIVQVYDFFKIFNMVIFLPTLWENVGYAFSGHHNTDEEVAAPLHKPKEGSKQLDWLKPYLFTSDVPLNPLIYACLCQQFRPRYS